MVQCPLCALLREQATPGLFTAVALVDLQGSFRPLPPILRLLKST
jgi:hypothetical protein